MFQPESGGSATDLTVSLKKAAELNKKAALEAEAAKQGEATAKKKVQVNSSVANIGSVSGSVPKNLGGSGAWF